MEMNDLLDYPVGTFRFSVSCEVEKVVISDGMYVEKGQTMFIMKTPTPSSYVPKPLSDESQKSRFKKSLDGLSNLTVASPSLVENQQTTNADAKDIGCSSRCSRRRERVMNRDAVMNRYKTFRKFDSVVDHSDHLFSAHTCVMKHLVRYHSGGLDINPNLKNFEDFVVGHFRNRASDIIFACSKKGCSAAFIDDLVSCMKFVTAAFKQTGALDRKVVMIGLKKHEVNLELKNYVVYK